MGESKFIKRFMRLLAECEAGHIYHGKINDFIKDDLEPNERSATGIVVTGNTGTHRIDFASGQKKYIEDASRFRIGDEVIVLGKKNHSQPNTTIPSIILIPEEEAVVLSKEHLRLKFHGWVDYAQVLFYILCSIFGSLLLFRDTIYLILDGPLYFYRFLVDWSGFVTILSVLALILVNTYTRQKYRDREILCDTYTWNIINDEIIERFGAEFIKANPSRPSTGS